jgi:predicted MFS family arabinose efflux permease
LVVVGQSASGLATELSALVVCRALTGVGAGAALAASSASLSATDEPERLYARVTVLRSLGLGLLLPILPFIIARWGHAGAYVPMAALALVSIPAIAWLPAPVINTVSPKTGAAVNAGWAVALLAAIILIASGDGAIWAFSERIGVSTGLSSHTVGVALAGSTLMGLLGAGAADYFGTSLGRTGPLVAAVAMVVAASFVLTHANEGRGFLMALVVYATAFFFLVPYLMGSAAALDSTGRWSAAASAMFLGGQAIGPAIGGIVMTSPAGEQGLSWLALCLGTVALLLAVPVTKYLDRQSRTDCSGAGLDTGLDTQPQA